MHQRYRGTSGHASRFRNPAGTSKPYSRRRVVRGKSLLCRYQQFCLVVLVVLFLYSYPEKLVIFLKGPITESQPHNPSQPRPLTRPRREDSDSSSEAIFTTLTRRERADLERMKQVFLQEKKDGLLIPCNIDTDCVQEGSTSSLAGFVPPLLRKSYSRYSKIKLYNPLPFHRYVCDKVIWGSGGTVELEGNDIAKCLSDSQPYVQTAQPPPLAGKGMKPVELFWNYGNMIYYDYYVGGDNEISFETKEFPCSVPCRTAGDYALLSVISVKDTKWEILSTMEGEKYYAEARVNNKSYRHDQYYAVTSFQSDIPLPYFSWDEYNIQHAPVQFDKVIKGASFLAKNCDSANKREELVLALMKTSLRVDSLSDCHHNAEPPRGVNMANKTAILEQYLFHLAFENQRSTDYITEKLWGALASGTLPVYWGAPNIKDHVPPHSVIFVDDFASPQDLADYLVQLTKDKALYNSYHTWREKPIDPSFRDKYEFTKTHSTCRMCHWAYAKRHGLGWNHAKQHVEEPHILHKTCRNKVGLVGHPFKEYWLTGSGDKAVSVHSATTLNTCTLDTSNRLVQVDGGAIQRKVFDQDGITDLIIDSVKMDGRTYLLKLETPIVTTELRQVDDSSRQEWWLQDAHSRVTILTSWPVAMVLVKQGTVQLPITESCRIRIIVEDVDTFHKGAKKYHNYFGDLMRQDFFSPVEAYFVTQH